MTKGTCSVEGCSKTTRSRGYCYAHYMKVHRYGTPTPTHRPRPHHELAGQVFGDLTAIEWSDGQWICQCSCGESTSYRGPELLRGNAKTCGIKRNHWSNTTEYHAAHDRVQRRHGPAAKHECVDCGRPAAQWSYNHQDPNERISTSPGTSNGLSYSLNPGYYEPRCVPCHKRFDLGRIQRHKHASTG